MHDIFLLCIFIILIISTHFVINGIFYAVLRISERFYAQGNLIGRPVDSQTENKGK